MGRLIMLYILCSIYILPHDASLHSMRVNNDLEYIRGVHRGLDLQTNHIHWMHNTYHTSATRFAHDAWNCVVEQYKQQLAKYSNKAEYQYVGDDINTLERSCRRYSAAAQLAAEIYIPLHAHEHLHNIPISRTTLSDEDPIECKLLQYTFVLHNLHTIRTWIPAQNIANLESRGIGDIHEQSLESARCNTEQRTINLHEQLAKRIHMHKYATPKKTLDDYIYDIGYVMQSGYTDKNGKRIPWNEVYNAIIHGTQRVISHLNAHTYAPPFDQSLDPITHT